MRLIEIAKLLGHKQIKVRESTVSTTVQVRKSNIKTRTRSVNKIYRMN